MEIPQDQIEKLRVMYQKSFSVVISEREAYEIGLRLIRLVRVVYGSQERDEPETSSSRGRQPHTISCSF
ncbi:MAG: hypothetical protein UX14_C0040G0002 [Parcubacteria group bacterium GW2011_GWF1_45_5]|nr:MAG: hypothetical protein UX14_C0040G0002 [Parcubacteria group bacterium GW2011_GWF1_45_5]